MNQNTGQVGNNFTNRPLYKLDISLPGLPANVLNGSFGNKWAKGAEKKKWRYAVYLLSKFRRPQKPLTRVAVICTRYSTVCRMDFDNRVASFKPLLDGLKDGGIIIDDNDSVIIHREYKQEKVSKGNQRVRIQVFELGEQKDCPTCGKPVLAF